MGKINKIKFEKVINLKPLRTIRVNVDSIKEYSYPVRISVSKIQSIKNNPIKSLGLRRFLSNVWFRIFILGIIIPVAVFNALNFENTIAFFGDNEASLLNTQTSSSLDFILDDSALTPTEQAFDFNPGDSVTKNIKILDDNGVDFVYFVEPKIASNSSNDFCFALKMKVSLEGTEIFNGYLFDFESQETDYSNDADEWIFQVIMPADALNYPGLECNFDFVYKGWQKEYGMFENGYYDEEFSDNHLEVKEEVQNIELKIKDNTILEVPPLESPTPDPTPEATPSTSPEPSPETTTSPEVTPESTPNTTPLAPGLVDEQASPSATPEPTPSLTPEPNPTESLQVTPLVG